MISLFAEKAFWRLRGCPTSLNIAAPSFSKVECLRRELMANISHDLRTPLTFIYSYAEMMHDFPDEINPEHSQIIMDGLNADLSGK